MFFLNSYFYSILFKRNLISLDFALYGGDDYELCFSVPFSSVESVLELATIKKTRISQVGCTTATKGISLVKGKTKVSANIKGYTHF